jgi:hypothetical protein
MDVAAVAAQVQQAQTEAALLVATVVLEQPRPFQAHL